MITLRKSQFVAGEDIRGEVNFNLLVSKIKSTQQVEVHFFGEEICRLGKKGGSAQIISEKQTIWERSKDFDSKKEAYSIPFQFKLPLTAPGSISHKKASIRYTITANLQSNNSNKKGNNLIISVEIPVLSNEQNLLQRARENSVVADSSASFKSGRISAKLRIGEQSIQNILLADKNSVVAHLELNNESKKTVTNTLIRVIRVTNVFVPERPAPGNQNLNSSDFLNSQVIAEALVSGSGFGADGSLSAKQTASATVKLNLPTTTVPRFYMSTFGRLCTIEFFVEAVITVKTMFSSHKPLHGLVVPLFVLPAKQNLSGENSGIGAISPVPSPTQKEQPLEVVKPQQQIQQQQQIQPPQQQQQIQKQQDQQPPKQQETQKQQQQQQQQDPPPPPEQQTTKNPSNKTATQQNAAKNHCVLCDEKTIVNTMLMPCEHCCVCFGCSLGLRNCPVCNRNVDQVVRTFAK